MALVLRVVNVTDNPPGFFADEAALGYNAYTLLASGTDEYGEPWPILFRSNIDILFNFKIASTIASGFSAGTVKPAFASFTGLKGESIE